MKKTEITGMPELGDEVECMVTGAKGTVVCHSKYLTGCDRISIQPKIGADGKIPDWHSMDITVAKILKKKVITLRTAEDLATPSAEKPKITPPVSKTRGGPAPAVHQEDRR